MALRDLLVEEQEEEERECNSSRWSKWMVSKINLIWFLCLFDVFFVSFHFLTDSLAGKSSMISVSLGVC